MWIACHLPLVLVPSHVAGVPADRLGVAAGFCYLSGGGRRSVAVVAAHPLFGLVVFLRLVSGWGLRFDVTAASCSGMAMWVLSLFRIWPLSE